MWRKKNGVLRSSSNSGLPANSASCNLPNVRIERTVDAFHLLEYSELIFLAFADNAGQGSDAPRVKPTLRARGKRTENGYSERARANLAPNTSS
jgi:hypothetical protein